MNKRKLNTMLAVLVGTSLFAGGQAYADESHKHQDDKKSKYRYNYDRHPEQRYEFDFENENNQLEDLPNQDASNEESFQQEPAAQTPDPSVQAPDKSNNDKSNSPSIDQPNQAAAGDRADQVIEAGKKYMGTPYDFGSSSKTTSTFDCSSFTQRAFGDIGVSLPRDSRQQSTVGQEVSMDQLQKGDLIFFRSAGSSSSRITHVAIYAGNDELLHTFGKPGVTLTKFSGTNWEKRFVTARRVL